jgi:hypothetical protein
MITIQTILSFPWLGSFVAHSTIIQIQKIRAVTARKKKNNMRLVPNIRNLQTRTDAIQLGGFEIRTPLYTARFRKLPLSRLAVKCFSFQQFPRLEKPYPQDFYTSGLTSPFVPQFDHNPSITLKLQGLPLVEIPAC